MLVSTFDARQFFSCLSATAIVLFILVRVCGKLKIEFTQNDLLFQSGVSGLSFGSRQNVYALTCFRFISHISSGENIGSLAPRPQPNHAHYGPKPRIEKCCPFFLVPSSSSSSLACL
jgi:hypothetical protein